MLEKISRYCKFIIPAALSLFAVTASFSLLNKGELDCITRVSAESELTEYAGDPEKCEIGGIVPIEYFKFSNTRYVKVIPGGTYKIECETEPENANENLVWTSTDTDVVTVSDDGTVTGVSEGEAYVHAETGDGKIRRVAVVTVSPMPGRILEVPYINQVYDYPNGCESCSTVMALNSVGIDISVDEFIEKYLDMSPLPEYNSKGELWGYSPWDYFVGDPREYSGLCCYSPVITKALNKFVDKEKYEIKELRDEPLEFLCRDYISNGIPVIFWGTMYMNSPYVPGWEWNVIDGKKGEVFRWTAPMHCLLLIGFDNECYYFNDPVAGKGVAYTKSDTEAAYNGMFRQAVVIKPR